MVVGSFFSIDSASGVESNNRLVDAIIWFTQKAKEWNKNQFGNIFTRKKNLMSRLNVIQRALALRPSE